MYGSELYPDCPIRNILARISDKWSLLVMHQLISSGTLRFNALQRSLPDVSQKMLTNTLRNLETDGMLTRTVYAEVPPRVEYALTERGRSVWPHIDNLVRWAKENMTAILADRARHKRTRRRD